VQRAFPGLARGLASPPPMPRTRSCPLSPARRAVPRHSVGSLPKDEPCTRRRSPLPKPRPAVRRAPRTPSRPGPSRSGWILATAEAVPPVRRLIPRLPSRPCVAAPELRGCPPCSSTPAPPDPAPAEASSKPSRTEVRSPARARGAGRIRRGPDACFRLPGTLRLHCIDAFRPGHTRGRVLVAFGPAANVRLHSLQAETCARDSVADRLQGFAPPTSP
jgi:hypothetical protein